MKNQKVFVFDYFGVLTAKASFGEYLNSKPFDLPLSLIECEKLLYKHWNRGKLNSSYDFWTKAAKELTVQKDLLRRTMISYYKPYLPMMDLVKDLSRTNDCGLCTNHTKEWLELIIKRDELKEIFFHFVTSYDVGFAKPSHKIFIKLLEKVRSKPKNIIFIDDSQSNIVAAKNFGITTIHHITFSKTKQRIIKLLT